MNKQEKNIVDVLTFGEIEDIVYVFINAIYDTDKTIALIGSKDLIKYAMDEVLSEGWISVMKVDLELNDIAYMISIDVDGNMVVQPVEYYNDKYFAGIEYAYVDMDGCVEQLTIDVLLDRDVPVVLFGCDEDEFDDEYDCCECDLEDLDECVHCGELDSDKSESDGKNAYTITVKCDIDTDEAEKIIADMEKRVQHMNDMFAEMDKFTRMFRW